MLPFCLVSPAVWVLLLQLLGAQMIHNVQDTRGDRQPSFTQMDLEMTFADQNVIMKLTEDLMRAVFKEVRWALLI